MLVRSSFTRCPRRAWLMAMLRAVTVDCAMNRLVSERPGGRRWREPVCGFQKTNREFRRRKFRSDFEYQVS